MKYLSEKYNNIFKIRFNEKRILNIFLIFSIFVELILTISYVFLPIFSRNLFLIILISLLIFILCLYLNFKGKYLISSGLFLITFSAVFFAISILNFFGLNPPYKANDVDILIFLICPVLISVILLPKLSTSLFTLANGAVMLLLTFIFKNQLFTDVLLGPFMLYTIISLFGILAAYYRADVERRKRYQIMQNKIELESVNKELLLARDQLKTINNHLEEIVAKRTEEIKNLIEQKNEFIHLLSHDLKNPLTPMNTLLPIIEQKVTDEETKKMIQMLIQNVQKMKHLINETLKVARLDHVGKELDVQSFNLQEIVTGILTENSVFLQQNNANVICTIDDNIDVLADKMQVGEIFNNLLTNSVKYCPPDKKCNICINAAKQDINTVKVSFTDNGIGLSTDQMKHVFEEFYKGAKPREGMDSTGLGLSICKSIVDNHEGKIWVESEGVGKGTTFHFTLPLRIQQKTEKIINQFDSYKKIRSDIDNFLSNN